MNIYAEFENIDLADIACTNIRNNVTGVHRISITDKSFPAPYGSTSMTTFAQGVNAMQPYVTEIAMPIANSGNGYVGSAHVNIKCDPQSAAAVKRRLISRGAHSVKEQL